MVEIEDAKKDTGGLHWLAHLLTGRHDLSIEIAVEAVVQQGNGTRFFPEWMRAWSRRIVMAKAVAAVRGELTQSAQRTRLSRIKPSAVAPRNWSLDPKTTKADIEEALLAIDIFPRAVVVLSIFEGVRIPDAAIILDADAALVTKAQAVGLRELVRNLARKSDHAVPAYAPALRFALATQ